MEKQQVEESGGLYSICIVSSQQAACFICCGAVCPLAFCAACVTPLSYMELILNVSVLLLPGISCSHSKIEVGVGEGLYHVKHLYVILPPAFPEYVSGITWFCAVHL